jgi:hypothetical protein
MKKKATMKKCRTCCAALLPPYNTDVEGNTLAQCGQCGSMTVMKVYRGPKCSTCCASLAGSTGEVQCRQCGTWNVVKKRADLNP